MAKLLRSTNSGLYCEAGDFYIDPWKPVDKAIITHAHSDHARWGSKHYLAAESSIHVLRERLGSDAHIQTIKFGERIDQNGVTVSLHPAGHLLGSSQIRIEHKGEVWVMTGDYKIEPDVTCEPFELVKCNTFITESTFGLPIYHWKPQAEIFADIHEWRLENIERERTSVIFAYPLGKSQRLLAGVDPNLGPIVTHGSINRMTNAYRRSGIAMPETKHRDDVDLKKGKGILVIAPPSTQGTVWLRKFGAVSTAFASGWMQMRGTRRRRAIDRGFALSDHADWPSLLSTIEATGAEHVYVTHGYTTILAKYLNEKGIRADTIATHFEYEEDESEKVDEKSDGSEAQ
jgi:putative mRNA 3-end processing factor